MGVIDKIGGTAMKMYSRRVADRPVGTVRGSIDGDRVDWVTGRWADWLNMHWVCEDIR